MHYRFWHQLWNIILISMWVNVFSNVYFYCLNIRNTENITFKYLCFNNFLQNIHSSICDKTIKHALTNSLLFAIIISNHPVLILYYDYNLRLSILMYTILKTTVMILQYLSETNKHPYINHLYYNTFYMLYLMQFAAEISFFVCASFIIQSFRFLFLVTVIYYTYVFIKIQAPPTLQMFFFKKQQFYKNLKKKQF